MLKFMLDEKGSVAVLATLAITVLLGFAALAIDIGSIYLNKVQLSNMADSAALAGVQDLPAGPELAQNNAELFAIKNGKANDSLNVTINENKTLLTVNARRKVNLFFAKIYKVFSADVSAQSAATIRTISGVNGAVPLGVVKQEFNFGQTYTLKEGGGDGYDGNYGALALGLKGGSSYLNNLKYGYEGKLSVGQWIPTEPGNMSQNTIEGIMYRINKDPGATFNTVQKNSPRIVILPVLDSLTVNGRSEVLIVGFAAFFLEGVGGAGNNNHVYGKFMKTVVAGDVSEVTAGYGLYGAVLVK